MKIKISEAKQYLEKGYAVHYRPEKDLKEEDQYALVLKEVYEN